MKQQTREIKHGLDGYRRFACRCDICRKASSDRKRFERNRDLLPVQPMIDKYGEQFTKRFPNLIKRWQEEGIGLFVADRICVESGDHPYDVYGDRWYESVWNAMKEGK